MAKDSGKKSKPKDQSDGEKKKSAARAVAAAKIDAKKKAAKSSGAKGPDSRKAESKKSGPKKDVTESGSKKTDSVKSDVPSKKDIRKAAEKADTASAKAEKAEEKAVRAARRLASLAGRREAAKAAELQGPAHPAAEDTTSASTAGSDADAPEEEWSVDASDGATVAVTPILPDLEPLPALEAHADDASAAGLIPASMSAVSTAPAIDPVPVEELVPESAAEDTSTDTPVDDEPVVPVLPLPETPSPDAPDLSWTLVRLRAFARERGVRGYSTRSKAELVDLLRG